MSQEPMLTTDDREQLEAIAIYRALAGYKEIEGWTCERHVIPIIGTPYGGCFCTKCDEELCYEKSLPIEDRPLIDFYVRPWERDYKLAIVRFEQHDNGNRRARIVDVSPVDPMPQRSSMLGRWRTI